MTKKNDNKNNPAIWKKIAGLFFIIIGIIGLVLPGLQGIAMIVAGAILLGNKKLLRWLKKIKNYLIKR